MRTFFIIIALFLVGGCGTPSFLITPVENARRLDEMQVEKGTGLFPDKIALIEIEGMLANVRAGGFLQPAENPLSTFTEQLKLAEQDPTVKAVVLRINSPGGTVTTADTMYQMLVDFRKKTGKPVVASAQEVAASGAYYLACASDKIVVTPTSLVGSIGVIFNTLDFEGTMAKIGLRNEAIKSGPMKDIASPFRHMTPEERAIMQNLVDEFYARFVSVVTTNRAIKNAETLKLATDGRVFSGTDAVRMGLADQTGRLPDAISLAKQLGHSPGAQVVMYKRRYGYSGSIYAGQTTPPPQANVMQLSLPGERSLLPTGFYYLWQP